MSDIAALEAKAKDMLAAHQGQSVFADSAWKFRIWGGKAGYSESEILASLAPYDKRLGDASNLPPEISRTFVPPAPQPMRSGPNEHVEPQDVRHLREGHRRAQVERDRQIAEATKTPEIGSEAWVSAVAKS